MRLFFWSVTLKELSQLYFISKRNWFEADWIPFIVKWPANVSYHLIILCVYCVKQLFQHAPYSSLDFLYPQKRESLNVVCDCEGRGGMILLGVTNHCNLKLATILHIQLSNTWSLIALEVAGIEVLRLTLMV